MRPLRSSLAIAVVLASGAAMAAVAPTATKPSTAKPTTSGGVSDQDKPPKMFCPHPDKDTCLGPGYLDSTCGREHKAVCKPHVVAGLDAHREAESPPQLKMLRPKATQMPKDVKTGGYYAYEPSSKTAKKKMDKARKPYKKTNDVLAGMTGQSLSNAPQLDRTGTVNPETAALFHRKPAWKADGARLSSCEEYAYARNYSQARFVDAASQCKGDRECIFDVAYMSGEPGIAHRLYDEAGVPQEVGLRMYEGLFQKNDMFTEGVKNFVRANLDEPLGDTPDVLALEAALTAGKNYYQTGICTGSACNDTRKFKDEFAWHKRMHDVNATISQAEAEEYERRRAELRGLIEEWAASLEEMPNEQIEQDIVLPGDMRARDPFERFGLANEYMDRGRTMRQELQKVFGPGVVDMTVNQAKQVLEQRGKKQGAASGAVLGLLAAPGPQAAEPSIPSVKKPPKHKAGTVTLTPGEMSQMARCSRPGAAFGFEAHYRGYRACKVSAFLHREWQRKAAGQQSCLDLGNMACDWTPEMFEARILDDVPQATNYVADLAFCKRYKTDKTFKPAENGSYAAHVTLVKNVLDARKAAVDKELKAVGDYMRGRDVGQRLGKNWEGGDYIGDKDWFAAGYEYELGWEIEPAEKPTEDDQKNKVCALKGSAHADLAFDSWIVGGETRVVQGMLHLESRPETKAADKGDIRINAKLLMFDQSIFDSGGLVVQQTYGDDPSSDIGIQLPNPRPTFVVPAGPVPITGSMWGELLFGSTLDVSGGSSTECTTVNPKFGLRAEYSPFFGAVGLGQVGVGISGVVSAGIRASLVLIMLRLPVDVGMTASVKDGEAKMTFDSGLKLMLATLSGRISAYVEFLMFDEEFEIFRWDGFSTSVELMPRLSADVSLVGLE